MVTLIQGFTKKQATGGVPLSMLTEFASYYLNPYSALTFTPTLMKGRDYHRFIWLYTPSKFNETTSQPRTAVLVSLYHQLSDLSWCNRSVQFSYSLSLTWSPTCKCYLSHSASGARNILTLTGYEPWLLWYRCCALVMTFHTHLLTPRQHYHQKNHSPRCFAASLEDLSPLSPKFPVYL